VCAAAFVTKQGEGAFGLIPFSDLRLWYGFSSTVTRAKLQRAMLDLYYKKEKSWNI
jgi:hypothetical protein